MCSKHAKCTNVTLAETVLFAVAFGVFLLDQSASCMEVLLVDFQQNVLMRSTLGTSVSLFDFDSSNPIASGVVAKHWRHTDIWFMLMVC